MIPPLGRHAFPDREAAAAALADAVAAAIRSHAPTTLALAGGTSPAGVYRRLAAMRLPWQNVTVALTDEREVPPDHEDSNQRLLRESLLQGKAAAAQFADIRRRVPRPFDAVLLGMGADGHTASLFPDAPELAAALDPAAPDCVRVAPASGHARFSLSLPALLDCGRLFLLLFGADKAATFEAALQDGPEAALPVRAVLRRRRQPMDVYWAP
jgi:6-phosphogluconolactonase